MQTSSITILTIGLSLLCFVRPLRSDPQGHSTNYESYNLHNRRASDVHRVPSLLLSYPEETREGTYLQPEEYDGYGTLGSRDRKENSKGDGTNFEDENRGSDGEDEEELARKMRILDQLLSEDSSGKDFDVDVIGDKDIIPEESKRVVREVKKKRPGLFWSLAKVTFQVRDFPCEITKL